MTRFELIKWLHVLGATVLFGTGLGTAFHCWLAHLSREPRAIAVVLANVVRADWLFTLTSGIVQPVTGFMLLGELGLDWRSESWVAASLVLYLLALACWLPVVHLQIRMSRMAGDAIDTGTALPAAYYRAMKLWFALGWPAFLALIAVFWLMIAKPVLW